MEDGGRKRYELNKDTQRCRVTVGYKNTPDVLRAPDFSQRKLAWGKERRV